MAQAAQSFSVISANVKRPVAPNGTSAPRDIEMVRPDGSYDRSVIFQIAWQRAKRNQGCRTITESFAHEIRECWDWAKAARQAEFEWRNFKPLRTAPTIRAELKQAA